MSASQAQRSRAAAFRALHDRLLVLPNAWDAASAAVVVDRGAPAVATTSAGVSWACGVPDGQALARDEMAAAVARICRVVDVPVSADVESGYGPAPADVAATVDAVVDAGAVGINLEDSPGPDGAPLLDPAVQAERIAAAREAASRRGLDLWINARTDVYLAGVGEPGDRLEETLRRGEAVAAAGADGLFVPGVVDEDVLKALSAGPLPLNVMAGPGAPPVAVLAEAGVRRVSVGAAIAQAGYALVADAATELLGPGTYDRLAGGLDYGRLNTLVDAGR